MVAQPFWITERIAIVPRPLGGDRLDEEMTELHEAGIDVLVSMLEESEAEELGLAEEAASAFKAGVLFLNFPIPDHEVPEDTKAFGEFLAALQPLIADGKKIGIHCRGCVGRSSVLAASLLVRSGIPVQEVWQRIEAARGMPVPDTAEQRRWVKEMARQVSR
jgi:protein-tyrosine phosphatase